MARKKKGKLILILMFHQQIGDEHPLTMYYAYEIRNSIGIDFDPVTRKMWDTEVANHFGDEMKLEQGLKSGGEKI